MNKKLILFSFTIIGALQYKLWFGDKLVQSWYQNTKAVTAQHEANQALAEENARLWQEVEYLKASPEAIEPLARYELGMIRKGENYYQVIEPIE